MTLSYFARLLLQAAYFVVVARRLGASGFGAFAGAMAAVAMLSPFVGLGGGSLLIRYLARGGGDFGARWGATLARSVLTAGALLAVGLGVAAWAAADAFPIALLAVVAVAELVFTRLVEQASQAFQGAGMMHRVAQLQVLPAAMRLVAALPLLARVVPATAYAWSWLYLGATVASALVAIAMVNRALGRPRLAGVSPFGELRDGFHFSVGQAAQNVYNESDKAILAGAVAPAVVGFYTAAYRVVDVACAPLQALQFTAYSEFFRRGASGLAGTRAYARRLLPAALAYAVVAAAALWLGAPLLPVVFGAGFAPSVGVARWLAVLPLLRAAHIIGSDALTGAGYQDRRSAAQLAVAGLNVVLNLALIPLYSWRGAVWASIASDAALAVVMWTLVSVSARRTVPLEA